MHADLARLIRLQELETAADEARRAIADEPQRQAELDAKLDAARQALDHERQRLAANQAARRELEKELAVHQGRLAKYRDQLMSVKTNREYQAMQKEIEAAQLEIQAHEDRMLERLLEFDEVTALVKQAERDFADRQRQIEEERRQLAAAVAAAAAALGPIAADRAALAAELPAPLLGTFDRLIRQRANLAVVEVRDGRCVACQVRVRPQVHNEIRRGEIVFQCESCQRFLYFAAPAASS